MTSIEEHIKRSITQQDWARLFVECLHWNRLQDPKWEVRLADGGHYSILPIAELAGVKVYTVEPIGGSQTGAYYRKRVCAKIQKVAYHHLVLFAVPKRKVVFQCMREGNQYYEAPLTPLAPSIAQVSALETLHIPIQEGESTLDEVVRRLKQMFYQRQPERGETMDAIQYALEQLKNAIRKTKEHAADKARDAYIHDTSSELERLLEVKKQIEEFERKAQVLVGEWEEMSKLYPELPVPAEALSPSPSIQLPSKRRRGRRTRTTDPSGTPISRREYLIAILEAIEHAGGTAHHQDILRWVKQKLGHRFTEWHYAPVSSGEIRWENHVTWTYQRGKRGGYLVKSERKGYWSITEKGRALLLQAQTEG